MPIFPDLDALNVWLEQRCIEQWSEIQHGVLPSTVADVQAVEVASLMPPGRPFDGFVEHTKRVSPTCLVHFDREVRSIAYQIKAPRFPAYKDLTGFEFAASEINEAMVRQLHRGEFIEAAHNVVLIGGLAPARHTSPPRSACRRSNITTRRCGSTPPSTWSTCSRRRRR